MNNKFELDLPDENIGIEVSNKCDPNAHAKCIVRGFEPGKYVITIIRYAEATNRMWQNNCGFGLIAGF